MPSIIVNGKRHGGRLRLETWGDLLDRLERGEGMTRQVVTAARFSGVGVPTFRQVETLSRRIGDLGSIEVETATVSDLLHESARTAYTSIETILAVVARIARLLRQHELEAADREWSSVVGSLRMLTRITAMLVDGRGAGACRMHLDALVVRVCGLLDTIVERQTQKQWHAVARVLDAQLAPALQDWSSILQTLDGHDAEPGHMITPVPQPRRPVGDLGVAV